ncbi:MAG: hypothetical protein PHX51_04685 [Clostridia bacterium]|nr:hypothetical protein [Clostridia bacterium]
MKVCPHCNTQQEDDCFICTYCGRQIEFKQEEAALDKHAANKYMKNSQYLDMFGEHSYTEYITIEKSKSGGMLAAFLLYLASALLYIYYMPQSWTNPVRFALPIALIVIYVIAKAENKASKWGYTLLLLAMVAITLSVASNVGISLVKKIADISIDDLKLDTYFVSLLLFLIFLLPGYILLTLVVLRHFRYICFKHINVDRKSSSELYFIVFGWLMLAPLVAYFVGLYYISDPLVNNGDFFTGINFAEYVFHMRRAAAFCQVTLRDAIFDLVGYLIRIAAGVCLLITLYPVDKTYGDNPFFSA